MNTPIALLLTLLMSGFAPLSQAQLSAGDIQHLEMKLDAVEKVAIEVGGQQQTAYYLKEASGKANGGLLLLSDSKRHPLLKGSIETLRYALAENHWHTLAIDTSTVDMEQAGAIIDAGMAFLNQRGVFNIAILGEGNGALQAVNFLSKKTGSGQTAEQSAFNQLRAVVLLHVGTLAEKQNTTFNQQLSQLTLPILDAYNNGIPQQKLAASERGLKMRRNGQKLYQQARLPASSATMQGQDNRTTRRIRGWLDKNVAGFMVSQ